MIPRTVWALLLAGLIIGGVAHAAGEPPNISPEAKRHVDEGVAQYEAGNYQQAVDEFELAYRLSHRAALLFNIARAEAKLGHDEAAIAFLRRYLEERPDANDSAAVLAEIEAREQAIKSKKAQAQAEAEAAAARKQAEELTAQAARQREAERRAAEAQAQAAPQPQLVAPAYVEPPREHERRLAFRRAGLALIITGPILVGVGIGLGALAGSDGRTVQGMTGDFSQCCAAADSQGRASDGAGIALDIIGGVATLSGIILVAAGYAKPHRRIVSRFAPPPATSGARF